MDGGFYIEPTIFKGKNSFTIFQDEIFGPVLSVTTFKDFDEAITIANDTMYGLGAAFGVVMATPPTVPDVPSRQDACGPTAITFTLLTLPLVVTKNQASVVRRTK